MKKRINSIFAPALFTLATIITACSVNNVISSNPNEKSFLSKKDFAQLEKEYGQFKTKSISEAYLQKKLDKWMALGVAGETGLVREIEFARVNHPASFCNVVGNANNGLRTFIDGKVAVLTQMNNQVSFATFLNSGCITNSNLVLNLDTGNSVSYPSPFTGTTWNDLSGNNSNGSLFNGVSYQAGNGGSLTFNGSNSVTIPDNDNFNFGSGLWAVEAWIKSSTARTGTGSALFNQSLLNATANSSLYLGVGSDIAFYITTGAGSWDTGFNSGANINNNQWRHIVWTRDTSTSLRTYLDSIQAGSKTDLSAGYTMNNSSRPVEIGIQNNNSDVSYNGNIAIVRVYKGSGMSQAQVTQNFNALKGRFGLP